MRSQAKNVAGWLLVATAVAMLLIARRLDLLLIVAPAAGLISYWSGRAGKMGERKI